ncbi:hypothetical protein KR222_001549, partial [Zaprionus bogoriensis]
EMKAPIWLFFTWLLSSCLDLNHALFFKALKGTTHYGRSTAGNYGSYGGYETYGGGYGGYNSGYGGYSSGYYNGPSSGYGNNYNYNAPSSYRYGSQPSGSGKPQRKGRTYSDIARVLVQDRYLGLGAGRYLPRTPFSPLWG